MCLWRPHFHPRIQVPRSSNNVSNFATNVVVPTLHPACIKATLTLQMVSCFFFFFFFFKREREKWFNVVCYSSSQSNLLWLKHISFDKFRCYLYLFITKITSWSIKQRSGKIDFWKSTSLFSYFLIQYTLTNYQIYYTNLQKRSVSI